jgi:hypothetical protein
MSREEWQVIRHHIPNCFTWPEFYLACILGAVVGVELTELILNLCTR